MKTAFKLSMAFVIATFCANMLAYFYYSPALQVPNPEKFTDLKNQPSDHNPHGDEGYGNVTIDQYGFNNILGIAPAEANVVFIGSSQTEAQHVSSDENYVYLLNQLNPSLKAYNMGISASKFHTTFYRLPYLKTECPQAKVFVFEINLMPSLAELKTMQTIMLSGDIPEKDISWKQGNIVLSTVGQIPLARLLWRQFDHYRNDHQVKKPVSEQFDSEEYKVLLNDVLASGKAQAGDSKLIIFNLAKLKLNADGSVVVDDKNAQSEIFRQACAENGIEYVDMAEPFIRAYQQDHVLPYGFLNSSLGTGHLNIYGHQIIANTLISAIGR